MSQPQPLLPGNPSPIHQSSMNNYVSTAGTVMMPVRVLTATLVMEGNIFVNPNIKAGRRLTELLNNDKRFLVLSDVKLTYRQNGYTEPEPYPFIEVKVEAIEVVIPLMDGVLPASLEP
jgi:hypothetical protein